MKKAVDTLRVVWLSVIVLASVSCRIAFAHEITVANTTIVHPRLIVSSSDADTGYLAATIVNRGVATETLQAVYSNETGNALPEDSRTQTFVSIPGNGTAQIGPSGADVTFEGLNGPHFEESTIRLVLVFEHAGEVTVDAVIQIYTETD